MWRAPRGHQGSSRTVNCAQDEISGGLGRRLEEKDQESVGLRLRTVGWCANKSKTRGPSKTTGLRGRAAGSGSGSEDRRCVSAASGPQDAELQRQAWGEKARSALRTVVRACGEQRAEARRDAGRPQARELLSLPGTTTPLRLIERGATRVLSGVTFTGAGTSVGLSLASRPARRQGWHEGGLQELRPR